MPTLIPLLLLLSGVGGGSSNHPPDQIPLLHLPPLLPGVDGGSPATHTPLIPLLPQFPEEGGGGPLVTNFTMISAAYSTRVVKQLHICFETTA